MPGSSAFGKLYTVLLCRKLAEMGTLSAVVDCGCGGGTYHDTLGPHLPAARWIGIEVWAPYVERFRLSEKYDRVVVADLRQADFAALGPLDLAIFGDVLEHMAKEEAVATVTRALAVAAHVVVSIPVVPYPQQAFDENPFEAHVKDDWSHTEVMQSFPGITAFFIHDHIGVYVLTSTPEAFGGVSRLHPAVAAFVHQECPQDRMAWGSWQVQSFLA